MSSLFSDSDLEECVYIATVVCVNCGIEVKTTRPGAYCPGCGACLTNAIPKYDDDDDFDEEFSEKMEDEAEVDLSVCTGCGKQVCLCGEEDGL